MKKRHFWLSSISILAVILASCYKEIEIDIPQIETLPVANTLFQPDSLFTVSLSKTREILSNKPVTDIDGAFISLSQGNSIIDTLVFNDGIYTSDVRPIIGEDYQITIDIEGFETLKAQNTIPEAPNLISASFKDSVYTDSEGYFLSQAEIVFSDNPDEENYYELILQQYYDEEEWNELFLGYEEYRGTVPAYFDYETNDLVIENEGQLEFYAFTNPVFSDELFNGETYTMRANYSSTWNSGITSLEGDLVLILRSVSKDYYTYKKSLTSHIETQWSDVWDGVVEPSKMYTNIQGGYGIFAGYSQITDTIVKK